MSGNANCAPAEALLRQGAARLAAAGIGPARREAEWLLGALLHQPALALYIDRPPVAPAVAARFEAWIAQRSAGTPLQYLLGETDFFGRLFAVGPGVFIPRPETEAVLVAVLPALRRLEHPAGGPLRLLDAGTGSGCLAVTLACELPACVVVALEVSWSALQTARRNALRQGVGGRVHFMQGSWLEAVAGPVDAIISNPPYLPTAELAGLPRDVRQEPPGSLDGGKDGLDPYRRLLAEAPRVLRPGGVLVLECGDDQVPALRDELCERDFEHLETMVDLAGRPRGLMARRAPRL